MIIATSIAFIENLAQYDYYQQSFDFHNDYTFERMSYSDKVLTLFFNNRVNNQEVSLQFIDVEINLIDFFNVKEVEGLTLDNLYRGRIELDGKLVESSEDGKGYFYLEFYEGQKLEFWARSLSVNELNL